MRRPIFIEHNRYYKYYSLELKVSVIEISDWIFRSFWVHIFTIRAKAIGVILSDRMIKFELIIIMIDLSTLFGENWQNWSPTQRNLLWYRTNVLIIYNNWNNYNLGIAQHLYQRAPINIQCLIHRWLFIVVLLLTSSWFFFMIAKVMIKIICR